eukprot:CAMPEP_0182547888 /NCGR_PEP_ID=MMETSP1323-20130603/38072_1 /TAXON_ID=236787 /ORGANISM="Florenciella parvula, Strain RCC1693" /LENGTH=50 /DNA_ID=CAMNT_0024759237 /DNA_START=305 /DNA_END=453 /DNA_ORIENTATION=-
MSTLGVSKTQKQGFQAFVSMVRAEIRDRHSPCTLSTSKGVTLSCTMFRIG